MLATLSHSGIGNSNLLSIDESVSPKLGVQCRRRKSFPTSGDWLNPVSERRSARDLQFDLEGYECVTS
jgi:hypothetical protein